jgi:hypothetical protein
MTEEVQVRDGLYGPELTLSEAMIRLRTVRDCQIDRVTFAIVRTLDGITSLDQSLVVMVDGFWLRRSTGTVSTPSVRWDQRGSIEIEDADLFQQVLARALKFAKMAKMLGPLKETVQ